MELFQELFMNRLKFAAWVATLAAANLSFAAPSGRVDGNTGDRDGNITRAEAAKFPRLAERFDQLDTNKDGVLSAEERKAFAQGQGQGRQGEAMKRLDANGDGNISREETAKFPRLAKHFDQIDTNKDGVLSQAELQAARQKMGEK
jgi:uncharacterized protein YdcH (DUF465 family)